MKKFIAILFASILLAGCSIPDPEEVFAEEKEAPKEWININGSFTYLINDMNNSTQETIWINVNSSHGLIELDSFQYNITHLSFEVVNNTVYFHNYTYVVSGYLEQNNFMWNIGYAPNFGNASLIFPTFPFDVTIYYNVNYRIWNGQE